MDSNEISKDTNNSENPMALYGFVCALIGFFLPIIFVDVILSVAGTIMFVFSGMLNEKYYSFVFLTSTILFTILTQYFKRKHLLHGRDVYRIDLTNKILYKKQNEVFLEINEVISYSRKRDEVIFHLSDGQIFSFLYSFFAYQKLKTTFAGSAKFDTDKMSLIYDLLEIQFLRNILIFLALCTALILVNLMGII